MRKLGITLLLACAAALPAMAQTKISGTETCAKPDPNYSAEVGDQAGHVLMLRKASCKWDTPMVIEGSQATSSVDVSTSDVRGAKSMDNGYATVTLDSGDKFTARYWGTAVASKDGSLAYTGKWSFVSSTGKLKGIKGGGTYKGSGKPDGTARAHIEGEYTMAPMGAMKSMAPKNTQ
jgi:hypothetical protein